MMLTVNKRCLKVINLLKICFYYTEEYQTKCQCSGLGRKWERWGRIDPRGGMIFKSLLVHFCPITDDFAI